MFRYKFSILLAIVIAMLSLIPSSSMPDSSLFSIKFLDKIVHFSMYAFFGFVALLESRCKGQCVQFHILLSVVIFIMSAIIEVLQATVVATRSAEWFDLLANFSGLAAGYIAFRIFRSLRIFKSIKS
ncbi:MAG: VanZ family protein [Bacteroidota bacterium]